MSRIEFLQGLKAELEGRVPYSVIQENLRYYDSYISGETASGKSEEEVIEELGSYKLIARTIVDAALNTKDRPDGYETYGSGEAYDAGGSAAGGADPYRQERREDSFDQNPHIHYLDFSKWYVRLIAGLIVFLVIFLVMTLFFSLVGLAGWILSYIWPFLLVGLIIMVFKGPGR